MGTEIFKIDAPWAEKLTKTRVQLLMTPTTAIFPMGWLINMTTRGNKYE